jgi:putative RecB family exonuclease
MVSDFNHQIREAVMAVYSHSRLSTYEQCPRRYKFKYVEKFPIGDRKSVEGYMGGIVHEALRRLYELVMAGKVWEEEKLLAYYDEVWVRDRPSELYIRDEELSEEDFRKKGGSMLSDYYRMNHPFDQEKTVALERNITVNLDPEGQYRAQGFIDRLALSADGTMQIHDYKTSRSIVRQQNLDEDRQLAMYQLGVQQMWPDRKEYELVWHYLAVPERRTSRRTDLDIDTLVESIITLIREIGQAHDDDNFPTIETRLCNWCEYMSFCEAKIHPLSVHGKSRQELSGDEVVNLVDQYASHKRNIALLQNEAEEIRRRLIHFARENDLTVIAGSDRDVSIRYNSNYRPLYSGVLYQKEDEKRRFIEFLVQTRMIDRIFSYNSRSFDSFIKRAKYDPKFKDELFEFIEVIEQKPSMTIRHKKE